MAHLCQILEVSRSGFYAWTRRLPSAHAQRDTLLVLVSIGTITCVVPGRFSTAPGGNELLAA